MAASDARAKGPLLSSLDVALGAGRSLQALVTFEQGLLQVGSLTSGTFGAVYVLPTPEHSS